MKFTANVECTPEEARAFMGLPDIRPMQDAMMKEFEERLRANIQQMNPETVLKTWLPVGVQGAEQMQKMFWSQMQQAVQGMTSTASGVMGNTTKK